ncbi:ribosomal L1 domain-containing protein 1-like [Limulus polyphemus]|uniref:Ribosomal L1 domain-containing protein 1-like n=1 Tax=Limulus polyphemus TaxID=6850 RepID=A0ABM1B516_LIMPO|nr:ribosomal L1 domain-containing protein 1-like [Limulus polyphemus]
MAVEDCNFVEEEKICEAISALRGLSKRWEERNEGKEKTKQLFEDKCNKIVHLQISLKKMPSQKFVKMIKISLPHTLMTEATNVCLFTGDLNRWNIKADIEPTIQHYKDLLAEKGIDCITEVIPLRQLRTEFKPQEAKRHLADGFNIFLADKKIMNCLIGLLGKHFFKKQKYPLQLNMEVENLKKEIEKTLSKTVMYVRARGSCSTVPIGHLDLSDDMIKDNILVVCKKLAEEVPGKWENIHSCHIKTDKSVALPIYMSSASINNVVLPKDDPTKKQVVGDVTTLRKTHVKVFPDGKVSVVQNSNAEDSDNDQSETEELEKRMLKIEEKKMQKLKHKQFKRRRLTKKRKRSTLSNEFDKTEKGNSPGKRMKKIDFEKHKTTAAVDKDN